MSVESGFFNATYNSTTQTWDRTYTAEKMGAMFDGMINDGIYEAYGNAFEVTVGTGRNVIVKSGRGWFQQTWITNDADYVVSISAPDASLTRIDAIVIDCNKNSGTRANTITVVEGTPASTPAKPAMTSETGHQQYPLAYVTVTKDDTSSIPSSQIENARGVSGGTNFVTGILENTSSSATRVASLTSQWTAAWNEYETNMQTQMQTVLDSIEEELEDLQASTAVELKKRQFTNVTVLTSAFVDESSGGSTPTYEDYPWCATVPLTGVLSTDTPDIIFDYDVVSLGIIAPMCRSYDGGVKLYATEQPESSIVIANAIFWVANS